MKYKIIYLDPPWHYNDKASAGKRGAEHKYPVMKQTDLANLPINDIADEDCAMFLWVTMPKLNEVFELIEKWGFTYKTVAFTWVKQSKTGKALHWGMGNWTRANAELCLLAIKGKPTRISASVHSVVFTPVEGHSKKPNEVRNRIVQLCGDLPRVELFARERVDGWDSFGFDIDGRNLMESLAAV